MAQPKPRAFTLIELLVVILLIAIMASVVVPAYGRMMARSRFDEVVREVRDVFAAASQQAVASDATTTVSFDAQSETLALQAPPPPPSTDQPAALAADSAGSQDSAPQSVSESVQLPPRYAVGRFQVGMEAAASAGPQAGPAMQNDVHFRGDGTCDGAEMIVQSADGYSVRIMVWPATGQVSVADAAGE